MRTLRSLSCWSVLIQGIFLASLAPLALGFEAEIAPLLEASCLECS